MRLRGMRSSGKWRIRYGVVLGFRCFCIFCVVAKPPFVTIVGRRVVLHSSPEILLVA